MNSQEYRNLQEAYLNVYQEEVLDELDSSIYHRVSHKRMQNLSKAQNSENIAKDAGARMGELTRVGKNVEDASAKVVRNRRLSFAHANSRQRMRDSGKTVNDSYNPDLFDVILEYLITEGYADTNENALVIMANMSEDWREEIINEAAADQSDKQLTRGMNTTYKAQGIIDNRHQGKMGPNFKKLPKEEQSSKIERMERRLKTRRNDISGEQKGR